MSLLQGRTAVVTGAARGIGAATAEALRAEGVTVVGVDRERCTGVDVSLEVDLSDPAQLETVIARVWSETGRLDALVNNAGLARHAPLTEIDLAELELMWAVNVRATIALTRDAMRAMARPAAAGGRIVNVISTAGLQGQPGESAYCATKAAVRGFTEAAAEEGRVVGVHVTGLYPAGVTTGFWDQAVGDRSAFTADKSWLDPSAVAAQVVAVLALPEGVEVPSLVVRQAGDVDAQGVTRKLGLVRR
jgi:NAD(P)-dependent dehydrogenase (short-subunit alcohol dehydrogenase family)